MRRDTDPEEISDEELRATFPNLPEPRPEPSQEEDVCPLCQGRGYVMVNGPEMDGMEPENVAEDCPLCQY